MEYDIDTKLAYAEAVLRNQNPFAAALAICNNVSLTAINLCDTLESDPEVIAIKKKLVEQFGEEHFLPSKSQIVREVLNRSRVMICDDDYIKGMTLVAKMQGHIQDNKGVTINNNNSTNLTMNKVMLVPQRASNEDWERGLLENQKVLTANE